MLRYWKYLICRSLSLLEPILSEFFDGLHVYLSFLILVERIPISYVLFLFLIFRCFFLALLNEVIWKEDSEIYSWIISNVYGVRIDETTCLFVILSSEMWSEIPRRPPFPGPVCSLGFKLVQLCTTYFNLILVSLFPGFLLSRLQTSSLFVYKRLIVPRALFLPTEVDRVYCLWPVPFQLLFSATSSCASPWLILPVTFSNCFNETGANRWKTCLFLIPRAW